MFLQDPLETKSSDEICAALGIVKPVVDYSSPDMRELTNYKLFSQTVRPMIQRENARLAQAKVVQLMGAMWREYLAMNPVKEAPTTTRKVREGMTGWCVYFCEFVSLLLEVI